MTQEQTEQTVRIDSLTTFLVEVRPRLERALVARFGLSDGLEAAAEAVAYAHEHWADLEQMGNPAGYLYRVGQSKGRRLVGRWHRVEALQSEPATTDGVVDIDLQRALLRLRPVQRVAIVLVYAHGHSYAEVADVLGVPVTTVTNHLNRGRRRLRRILGVDNGH